MSQAALRPCWDAAAESRAPAEQQRLRLEGVRRVLDWVGEHSPFYRERLRKAGVDPGGIRTLDDFAAAVPLTAKQELRDAMERMGTALPHLCVPREQVMLAGPSAGTSGRQTYQAFTAEDLAVNAEITARLPAETAGETERRIAAHLSKELGVPVQAGFHDRLPYVGYKTLRVVDEKNAPVSAY